MLSYRLSFRLIAILFLSACSTNKEFDDSGRLVEELEIKGGKEYALQISYMSNGDTLTIKDLVDGSLVRKREYTSDGLYVDERFVDGKKNGPFIIFWPKNGNVQIQGHFKSDSLDGIEKHYYSSGVLEVEMKYRNGQPFGQYIYYYENGVVQLKSMNFGDGEHLIYDSLGNLDYTVIMQDLIPIDTLFP